MRRGLLMLLLASVGVFLAGSIGYAAYLASRDSVGLPVTKLETTPHDLAPTTKQRARRRPAASRHAATTQATTTVDDHGRRGRDDHSGSSGHGSGGGGDD